MNELQVFSYEETQVRTIHIDGEPWWVLADVCQVLDLGSPHKVADRLDDDEKGRTSIPTLGGIQQMTIVNEPGLYSVILRSDKPQAKPFFRWITHEVVPSIRKTGAYGVPKTTFGLPAPRVATAKRILAQRNEILEEIIPDRPETQLNAMKKIKNLLKENGFNCPSIVVDPKSATLQDIFDAQDFGLAHPGATWEDYLAYLLIPRLTS